jgi:hypothetical protein
VHLRMSALAGVATQGVGQADYLLQDLECRTMKEASAGFTAGRLPTEGTQLPRLANGTDDKVAVGTRCWRSHLFPPFPNCTAHARVRTERGLESERYRGIIAIVIESAPRKKRTPGAAGSSLKYPWRTSWLCRNADG